MMCSCVESFHLGGIRGISEKWRGGFTRVGVVVVLLCILLLKVLPR